MTGARRRPDRTRGGRRRTASDRIPRMRDVTHVHADHDPRAWHWFARGPTVAADGGRRGDDDRTRALADEREDRDGPRNVEDERIRDVSHEPVEGDGANRVWERGEAGRDDEAAG